MDMDPIQAGKVTAILYAGKKVLGPSLGWFGGRLKQLIEEGAPNILRILHRATERLGDKVECDGGVPWRVAHEVLESGALSSDDLQIEYFAGILAASKSDQAVDDRGANLAKLVARLSLYQLRAHYVLYSVAQELYRNSQLRMNRRTDCGKAITFVFLKEFDKAMCLSGSDDSDSIVPHILDGLEHEGLIGDYHTWSDGRDDDAIMRFTNGRASAPGIVFEPTVRGVELYIWAHGLREVPIHGFLHHPFERSQTLDVHIPKGSLQVGERRAGTAVLGP